MINKSDSKVFLTLIRYIPICTAFIIMVHASLQIAGIDDKILDHIVRLNPTSALFMLSASIVFKFCWIHRVFIFYDFLMSIEMVYHEEIGLYHTLLIHRIGAVVIGIVIFIMFIFKFKCFNELQRISEK